MTELQLLQFFKHKDNYQRFRHLIPDHALLTEVLEILDGIGLYFDSRPELNWRDFGIWFLVVHKRGLGEEQAAYYQRILKNLADMDDDVPDEIIDHFLQLDLAGEVSEIAEGIRKGTHSASDLSTAVDRFKADARGRADLFVTPLLSDLLDKSVRGGGLRWRLPELNESLGPLHKGDLMLLIGPPESGKTSLLASEASFMATQMDRPVLFVNNEEDGDKIRVRWLQAQENMNMQEILRLAPADSEARFSSAMAKLRLLDSHSVSIWDVERACREVSPGLILINTLAKIKAEKTDGEIHHLQRISQWARELAKQYAPVIGVMQAGADSINQRWVSYNMLYGSKIAAPAEADVILGLGRLEEEDQTQPPDSKTRFLTVSKNKLPGDEHTNPVMKHGCYAVKFNMLTGRYSSPGNRGY